MLANSALVAIPSGHVLMSTVDARVLAWPADVVLTTSNLNPASCHSLDADWIVDEKTWTNSFQQTKYH